MKIERKPCPCCGQFRGDPAFYARLDDAVAQLGKEPLVTSGYRCEHYNKMVSQHSTGRHTKGEAVDIRARHARDKGQLLLALLKAGLVSFATLPNGAGLHVDAGTIPWLGIE
jgi:uncharacterized protein YcbK (DUF882 family)